jgi:PRTRC genetic system ThiF family protein
VEDIGKQKASTTIERINRNFGFNWSAIDRYMKYSDDFDHIVYKASNFNVCCVDNVSARFEMDHIIKGPSTYRHGYHNSDQIYYHIDCGNSYDKGQVICGTTADIKQPGKGYKKRLRGIFDVFSSNDLNKASESEDKEASCSTFEALKRQDPFINSIVATYAAKIIWQLVKDHQIKHHGYFIDLEKSQPITAMSV